MIFKNLQLFENVDIAQNLKIKYNCIYENDVFFFHMGETWPLVHLMW